MKVMCQTGHVWSGECSWWQLGRSQWASEKLLSSTGGRLFRLDQAYRRNILLCGSRVRFDKDVGSRSVLALDEDGFLWHTTSLTIYPFYQ